MLNNSIFQQQKVFVLFQTFSLNLTYMPECPLYLIVTQCCFIIPRQTLPVGDDWTQERCSVSTL